MSPQLIDQPLYTVEQARHYLQIGRATLYRILAAGLLASVHIGRSRRIRRQDLEQFVEVSMARARSV